MTAADGTSCPNCQRALGANVIQGPSQAVVRCEGCSALLLWSNGRVVRTAKPGTPTVQGMAVAKPPGPASSPAPPTPVTSAPPPPAQAKLPPIVAAKPMPDDADADADDVTRIDGVDPNEPPLLELQPEQEPGPGKTAPKPPPTPAKPIARISPTRTALGMGAVNSSGQPKPAVPSTVTKQEPSAKIEARAAAAPSVPIKKEPSARNEIKPTTPPRVEVRKDVSSGRIDVKPSAQRAEMQREPSVKVELNREAKPETKPEEKRPSVVVGAVATVADAPGPMVDPASWFHEQPTTGKGPTVPSEASGAQPLPPPPTEMERLPPGEITGAHAMPPSARNEVSVSGPHPLPPSPVSDKRRSPDPSPFEDKTPPLGIKIPRAQAEQKRRAADPTPMGASTLIDGPRGMAAAAAPTPSSAPTASISSAPPPAAASSPPAVAPPRATPTAPTMQAQAPRVAASRSSASTVTKETVLPPVDPSPLPPPPSRLQAPATPEPAEASLMLEPRMSGGPSKKLILLLAGGGGAALLVVLLIVALTHGGPEPARPTAPTSPAPVAVRSPEPPPKPPEPPAPTPPPTAAVTPPSPSEPATPAASDPSRPKRLLGGKRVVLEYDPHPSAAESPPATSPVPAGESPETVARARESYHKGNMKLFAGDSDGAVGAYRDSLKIYPGYVAGYRGLGLAYAEQGNVDEALKALRTYVKTVPAARDVPIIQKRIQHLEQNK